MDPESEQTHAESEQTHAAPVLESNIGLIEYEDGRVEKKVYGDHLETESLQAVFHLIERETLQVDSQVVRAEGCLTIEQCSVLLQERLKIPLNNLEARTQLEGGPAHDLNTTISQLFDSAKLEDRPDIFFFYDGVKAVMKEKQAEVKYETIIKYSFLDDKTRVKVYIDLEGIGAVPEANITSRFLERSFEVRIHDYKGKNWLFAVPHTQCMLRPSESKVMQKKDKLIVSIKKIADSDNWFSLYKVKCIGEKED